MNYRFVRSVSELDKKTASLRVTQEKESYLLRLESGRSTICLGAGEAKGMTRRKLVLLSRKVIVFAKSQKIRSLAVSLGDFAFPNSKLKEGDLGEVLAMNFEMANYEFVKYKNVPKEGWNDMEEIVVLGKVSKEGKQGLERGKMIGQGVNETRTLSNIPGGEMTPQLLAKAAVAAAKGTTVRAQVLGLKEIQELKMGGLLGVSKGSLEEPRFIILEHKGAGAKERPIVLVGKGITFDSGGINLKPEQAMFDMHMDMSGGAAVIYALVLAAKLKIKKNVIGLIPAAENMPSGSSYRPGDVIKTMSGKTVEILSTDAEGRVVMADAFTYAKRYDPKLIVDAATLTGAAVAALGLRATALFATNEKLEQKVRELGEESGDYVWPFPLWEEYEEDIKGTFGDLNNTGKSRYGGAITAALFLKQFTEQYPFVHLDIAPRMTSIDGDFLAKGATGVPVRLFVKILEQM